MKRARARLKERIPPTDCRCRFAPVLLCEAIIWMLRNDIRHSRQNFATCGNGSAHRRCSRGGRYNPAETIAVFVEGENGWDTTQRFYEIIDSKGKRVCIIAH